MSKWKKTLTQTQQSDSWLSILFSYKVANKHLKILGHALFWRANDYTLCVYVPVYTLHKTRQSTNQPTCRIPTQPELPPGPTIWNLQNVNMFVAIFFHDGSQGFDLCRFRWTMMSWHHTAWWQPEIWRKNSLTHHLRLKSHVKIPWFTTGLKFHPNGGLWLLGFLNHRQ